MLKLAGLFLGIGFLASPAPGPWIELFNGKDLDGWRIVGDGLWSVMSGGILLGQRDERNATHQSWLYTTREFGEFDLQLEYWARYGANSGISIRDTSRARWACGEQWDRNKTPSHIGYEIQIANRPGVTRYPTGSIYLFQPAHGGRENYYDWNRLEIQSRHDSIRVLLNGSLVAEHPGDPARSKIGPIGLQLHDARTVVMFRRIRIREYNP